MTHQNTNVILIVIFSALCVCVGGINLSCDKVDPVQPSTLTCTCYHTNGTGILWYKNNKHMTDCYLNSKTCLGYNGSFSVNSTAKEYKYSKVFYNYSSCDVYTCRDLHQPEVSASQRIAAQDTSSISILNISEPTVSHTSGFIGITTECIYGPFSEEKYLDFQWLVVMGSVEQSFNTKSTTKKSFCGSCQLCDGDQATQCLIGFNHIEEIACRGKEAKFRIILRHNGNSSGHLNITTKNSYCVYAGAPKVEVASKNLSFYALMLAIVTFLIGVALIVFNMYRKICLFCKKEQHAGHDPAQELKDSNVKLSVCDENDDDKPKGDESSLSESVRPYESDDDPTEEY